MKPFSATLMMLVMGLVVVLSASVSAVVTTTINSPADNYVLLSNPQAFSGSSSSTGGVNIANMSLWTNGSASWGIKNTTFLIATDAHGNVQDDSDVLTIAVGGIIQPKYDVVLTKVTQNSSSTGNRTRIWYTTNGTLLATNVTAGVDEFLFNVQLFSGTNYTIEIDGQGADYTGTFKTLGAQSFPIIGSNINWIAGCTGENCVGSSTQVQTIESITTDRGLSSFTGSLSRTILNPTLWNIESCDENGVCEFAIANRTLYVESGSPRIEIESPHELMDYSRITDTEQLNITFRDSILDSCWYNYNGTNITIDGCTSGIKNATTFAFSSNDSNMTVWANDTDGNYNSTFIDWDYKVLENSRTHNVSSYETARETFSINLTANSSLTGVKLYYGGTQYTATQSGTIWTSSFDIPTSKIANNTIGWNFTYAGSTINSDYLTYQDIEAINLTYSTSETPYINFTFKDESDSSVINATIPTSTLTYWLGNGDVTKTLTYINTTANYYYAFNFTPVARPLNLDYRMQYESVGYPQRTSEPDTFVINSTTTDKTLYLLGTVDGIYVTFQIINQADQLLSGVDVTATRTIESTDVIVASGTTGSSGSVTFWLNPDFSHDFSFSKTGYTTVAYSETPTQTSYTVTLSGDTSSTNSSFRGIQRSVRPIADYLINDTVYTFAFNLTSTYWDTSSYGFNLRLANGTTFSGGSTGVEGTELTLDYNSTNQSVIYMDYWWVINGEYTNATVRWLVFNEDNADWSLSVFVDDLKAYLDSGIFGLDSFGRILITFLVLFISVGIMSYKYGFTSPMSITTLIFGIVFILDVVTGLIPDVGGVSNLPTFLAGLILVLTIINEVRTR